VQVQTIFCDETEVGAAKGGENLRLRLSGVDEDDVQAGFVVCDPHVVVPVVTYFEAQLQVSTSSASDALFSRCSGHAGMSQAHGLNWHLCGSASRSHPIRGCRCRRRQQA
jgi:translation elongation factor EF-1alpha